MKKLLLFTILLQSFQHLNAQDTIIKSNGEHVIAKIIEITAKEIKYKKFNFLDGPTYVENKTDLQLIKYSNGSSEKFQSASLPTPIQTPVVVKKQDSISKTPEPIPADDYYQPEKVQPTPTPKQTPVLVQKKDSIKKAPEPTDDYFQPAKVQPTPTLQQTQVVQKKDSIQRTPEKPVTDDYYGGPQKTMGSRSGQLSISKKGFKHNETTITEKEFYTLLKQTNDKEIISLVEKAGRAKKRQYIYFVCMVANTTMIIAPVVFIVVQPAFIFPYFRNRAVRKTSNKKAAELYNKKL